MKINHFFNKDKTPAIKTNMPVDMQAALIAAIENTKKAVVDNPPLHRLMMEKKFLIAALKNIYAITQGFYRLSHNEHSVRQMDSIMKIEEIIRKTIRL